MLLFLFDVLPLVLQLAEDGGLAGEVDNLVLVACLMDELLDGNALRRHLLPISTRALREVTDALVDHIKKALLLGL